ncbi:MAG: 3-octaprenyl-4-hydroxybenzoate carboxy-lyase, partial [Bacteroidota bacterium]
KIRELCREVPDYLKELKGFENPRLCIPGVIAIQTKGFTTYESAQREMHDLHEQLKGWNSHEVAQIVICDDSAFLSENIGNYLWVTYTRCNPSHDIYGIHASTIYKHWGCNGPVVFDARIKKHHAPALEKDSSVEQKINRLFNKGGSLYGRIK